MDVCAGKFVCSTRLGGKGTNKKRNTEKCGKGFGKEKWGKFPIRSVTTFPSLLLRGRPRAEGAVQAPVESIRKKGNFYSSVLAATQKRRPKSPGG